MTPSWLSTSLWISLYAVLWSYMEVEIEGKDGGWAKNLPSKKFFNTKFTWYHIIMNTIVITTIAYSLFGRNSWEILFYIVGWFMIEDFVWFMINPGFGWSKYTKKISGGMPSSHGSSVYHCITIYASFCYVVRDICLEIKN